MAKEGQKTHQRWFLFSVFGAVVLMALLMTLASAFGVKYFTYPDEVRNVFTIIALVFSASVVFVEFISPFFVKSSTFYTAFIALGVLWMAVFSKDGYLLIIKRMNLAENLDEPLHCVWTTLFILGYGGFTQAMLLHVCHDFPVSMGTVGKKATLFYSIIAFAVGIGLTFLHLSSVAILFFVVLTLFWMLTFNYAIIRANRWNAIYTLTYLLSVFISAAAMVDTISFDTRGRINGSLLTSVYIIMACLAFFGVYLVFSIVSARNSVDKETYKQRLRVMQSSVLRNQISSHFFFNTLNVIKANYHESTELGDRALDLLSQYYRSTTEAGDTYLVPLTKEIGLITSYLELYNLRAEKPFRILFNIEEYEYQVPYFSLQPLLENAIRYSGVNEMEEGYIQIDSTKEDDHYVLVFKDNGKGFNPSEIKSRSVGLRNVESRLRLLLGASMKIDSKVGEGTKITLLIPVDQEHHGGNVA